MSTLQLCYLLVRQSFSYKPRSRRRKIGFAVMASAVVATFVVWEMQTSTLQAQQFTLSARGLHYRMEPGPSASVRFPGPGPFDERLGYSRLPHFLERLTGQRYVIDRQARPSFLLTTLTDFGLFPIYREKTQAGLSILGCDGKPLTAFLFPQRMYPDFASVPPLVVQSLLFIENRELLDGRYPHRNPAIEWDRLGHAVVHRMARLVTQTQRTPGGSTLATQMEKYRHSPGGRTESAPEKFRQMASASMRAYLGGDNTLPVRQRIVVDYINTMPLAAAPGVGEVFGLADGLRAWYGADFAQVNALLRSTSSSRPGELTARARAYREVLSLFIAQRRPSGLLGPERARLSDLTDSHLRLLAREGLIEPSLAKAALRVRVVPGDYPRTEPALPIAEDKAADGLRTRLTDLLGIEQVYDLDRLDLAVETPLQRQLQAEIAQALKRLSDPVQARAAGVMGPQLLAEGDPSRVIYSFILLERTPRGNLLRVQADSVDHPFDVNDGAKLELGSTAKLRTLVSYLEVITDLHERLGRLDRQALHWVQVSPHDTLTRWAIDYLARADDRSLLAMLDAAMERRYSASPGEAFFTGGGVHHFENFHVADDRRIVTVREAFTESINLPFIRLMRDIVQHIMYSSNAADWLLEPAAAQRDEYLSRFADREGRTFLRRFYVKYHGKQPQDMMEALAKSVRPSATHLTVAFLSGAPDADVKALDAFLRRHLPKGSMIDAAALYTRYATGRHSLVDRGSLAGVHPLELWLVEFLRRYPGASFADVLTASQDARQEVYDWLFRTRYSHAQDLRIHSIREADAFRVIHQGWRKVGYPFESLVPSYATALGSSADRPAALAELMGIIVNDGMRMPTVRIGALHFASHTPFETRVVPALAEPERVLAPELAAVVKRSLVDVVERGTARRVGSTLTLANGSPLAFGGKTGTGDNRFDTYAPGGRLVSSRVVSRAATFVFLVGDRYFGTVTAYVPGEEAKNYEFTSALPVQVLKTLTPVLARNLGSYCGAGSPATVMTRTQEVKPLRQTVSRTRQKIATAPGEK